MSSNAGRFAVAHVLVRPLHALRALVFIVGCALLVACGGGGGGGGSAPPQPALAISSQPADASVTSGQSASFHVVASVAATYQWQRLDGGNWTAIAGATDAAYSIAAAQVSDNGAKLRVVVTAQGNAASTVTSSAATLTVTAAPQAPAIAVAPADASVFVGADASFSVTAAGTALNYRWQRSADGVTWVDVAGGVSASLTLPAVALADDGSRVRVVVTNSLDAVTSAAALLHVAATPVAPTFTAVPADITVVAGQPATFTASVSGTPAPALSWQVSSDGVQWSTVAGETGASLVLASVSPADSGKHYRAVAVNATGQVESPGALLTVTPQPVAAFITSAPADTSVGIGATPVFHAVAGGTPAPSYQWQVSSDGGTTYLNVNGATTADLALPAVALADNGKRVRLVATNGSGSATSASALLTVRPAPQITRQPESQAWRSGLPNPVFQVAGAGSGLSYRWQMRSAGASAFSDIAGATGSSVTVTPPATDADVRAIVTNATGDVATSDIAALTHLHWSFISPTPTGDEMRSLRWLDATTVLAVGDAGTVIRSTDAGATWGVVAESDLAHSAVLMALAVAPSGGTAIAAGYDGSIRRSTDGGLHWLTTRAAPGNGVTAAAAAFADATTVLVACSDGTMLRSVDGGLSWTTVSTGQSDRFEAVEFRAGVGVAVTVNGTFMRSINGGVQWSITQSNFGSSGHRVAFASDSVVVIAMPQSVARSTDAGQTWQPVTTATDFIPGDIAFSDALHGFELPGSDGSRAFATADGGLTWTPVTGWPFANISTFVPRFDSLRFGPGGVGVATGMNGTLVRTADGGQTWAEVSASLIPNHDHLYGAAFANATTGVGMSDKQLYRTSDAGQHWTLIPSGDRSTVAATWVAVRALDATRLLALDTDGHVLGSDDAGATWTARAATLPIQYNGGMAFADASNGFVATGDGKVQRTTDGGATWTTVYTSPSAECFNDVAVPSPGVAVVAGCSGTLLRTADGGATWTSVRGVLGTPATVTFSDANNGLSTGHERFSGTSSHMLQRTRDGGATWQDVAIASATFDFGKPWFATPTEGFIAADQEYWHTSDGGATWTLEAVNVSASIGTALDAHTSLAFGGRGSVVQRKD